MADETMIITGHLPPGVMREWLRHRARKLALRGGITDIAPGRIALCLHGPGPLLDAMEAACLLGPGAAMIDDVTRRNLGDVEPPLIEEFHHDR